MFKPKYWLAVAGLILLNLLFLFVNTSLTGFVNGAISGIIIAVEFLVCGFVFGAFDKKTPE